MKSIFATLVFFGAFWAGTAHATQFTGLFTGEYMNQYCTTQYSSGGVAYCINDATSITILGTNTTQHSPSTYFYNDGSAPNTLATLYNSLENESYQFPPDANDSCTYSSGGYEYGIAVVGILGHATSGLWTTVISEPLNNICISTSTVNGIRFVEIKSPNVQLSPIYEGIAYVLTRQDGVSAFFETGDTWCLDTNQTTGNESTNCDPFWTYDDYFGNNQTSNDSVNRFNRAFTLETLGFYLNSIGISNNYVPQSFEQPQFGDDDFGISSSTCQNYSFEIGLAGFDFDIGQATCRVISIAFVPSSDSFEFVGEKKDELLTQFPFSYAAEINAIASSSSMSTTTFGIVSLPVPGGATATISILSTTTMGMFFPTSAINIMQLVITYALWIAIAMTFYRQIFTKKNLI